MKKIVSNEKVDIIEYKQDKKDIVKISLYKNAMIKDTTDDTKYLNSDFLKITDRKGNTRVLDLTNGLDITNMLGKNKLELRIVDKTTIKPLFISE
jgi:hypothetical protein